MKTIAKFKCESVTEFKDQKEALFWPVTDGSEENEKFFKYTPSGELKLQTINKDVNFEPGKEYYIEIKLAE